jgi:hypothetical protein
MRVKVNRGGNIEQQFIDRWLFNSYRLGMGGRLDSQENQARRNYCRISHGLVGIARCNPASAFCDEFWRPSDIQHGARLIWNST